MPKKPPPGAASFSSLHQKSKRRRIRQRFEDDSSSDAESSSGSPYNRSKCDFDDLRVVSPETEPIAKSPSYVSEVHQINIETSSPPSCSIGSSTSSPKSPVQSPVIPVDVPLPILDQPSCSFHLAGPQEDANASDDTLTNESSDESFDGNDDALHQLVENIDNYIEDGALDVESGSDGSDRDDPGDGDASPDNAAKAVLDFIRVWSAKNNITLSAVSNLAAGLKAAHPVCFSQLPVDARTILKTPLNKVPVLVVDPGHYYKVGIINQLKKVLYLTPESVPDIHLSFNIDGLPLRKSGNSQLWPILLNLPGIPSLQKAVFPIGIYHGDEKPKSVDSFLTPFVDELCEVLGTNFVYKGRIYSFKVLGFCCDAPAKAFIMGCKGHTGFDSCTRCTVHGATVDKRKVFLDLNAPLRTDEGFRNREHPEFHNESTPLVRIPGLNFSKSFVLDYMHLMLLGVTKTLLLTWCSGGLPLQLSKRLRNQLSLSLVDLRPHIPLEFSRKPRPLDKTLSKWKATEFRLFLLYTGPLVLKNVLSADQYTHFLMLHHSSTILLSSNLCRSTELRQLARKNLVKFVQKTVTLYGETFVTHNFHNLIHIVDDADHFSKFIPNFSLNVISAFPFESFLGSLKKLVRGPARPLQQVARRLGELSALNNQFIVSTAQSDPMLEKCHSLGPLLARCTGPQFRAIKFSNFKVSVANSADSYCGLDNGDVVKIENIARFRETGENVIIGRKFIRLSKFYTHPSCKSSVNISVSEKLGHINCWPVAKIRSKFMVLPFQAKQVLFPILHCTYSNHS